MVCVITNTRVCRNPHTHQPEFMVAEHTVIQREDGPHSGHASTSGVSENSSSSASTSTSNRLKQSMNNASGSNPSHKGNIFQALFPDGAPPNKASLKSSLGQIDLPTLQSIIRKQKMQQQKQGMHMNNLDTLKKSSLTNILQQSAGNYSGGGGPDAGGMSYPATYGNNDKDGPVEKMPRLDRLSPEQNVASSMDAGDDGDVFLPSKSQDGSGPFRSQDMGNSSKSGMDGMAFRNNSSSNPSPDTNEDDKDLAKNTLLQKLLLEDIECKYEAP